MIDHSFGIAGRARGIVEGDRIPFVGRHLPGKARIARRHEFLVFELADPLSGAGKLGIVTVDDQRPRLGERERLLRKLREFAIDDQHPGLAVVQLEGDGGGVEPGVDGVEHRAGHRHAVVAFEHGGRVGEHDRDGVAPSDAAFLASAEASLRARA